MEEIVLGEYTFETHFIIDRYDGPIQGLVTFNRTQAFLYDCVESTLLDRTGREYAFGQIDREKVKTFLHGSIILGTAWDDLRTLILERENEGNQDKVFKSARPEYLGRLKKHSIVLESKPPTISTDLLSNHFRVLEYEDE